MLKNNKVTIIYFSCFIIVELFVIYHLYHNYFNKRDQYLAKKTNELQIAYSVIINGYNKISSIVFDEVINKPDVLGILKDASISDKNKQSEVRNELFAHLNPSYLDLNTKNSIFLHFQLPDCTSFLRFYNPGKYGDNLSSVRTTIMEANRKKIVTRGFEIGSTYNGYRFIYPLFYYDTHIGSVEIGISDKAIKNEMEKVFKSDFNFIIKKEMTGKNNIADDPGRYDKFILNENYLIEKMLPGSENEVHFLDYDNGAKIKQLIADKMKNNAAFSLGTNFHGDDVIISLIPIYNFEGVKIAYLTSLTKDNMLKEYKNDYYERVILFTIILLAIVIFVNYVSHSIRIIKNNRDFLQSVTDNMSEGLIVLNKTLKVISINHTAEKILDLNLHEAKGRNFANIVECKDENGHILLQTDWPFFANINYGFAYKSKNEFFVINKRQIEIPLELSVTPHYQKTDLIGYLIICKIMS